jgi:hypothetical protein
MHGMKVYAQLPKTQKDTGRIHNKRRRKLYIFAEYAKVFEIQIAWEIGNKNSKYFRRSGAQMGSFGQTV